MSMTETTFYDDTFNFKPAQLRDASSGAGASLMSTLPQPGFYEVRVVSGGFRMDRDDKTIQKRDKNGRPIFAIDRIAILQPSEYEGSFPLFQDVYASGFLPKDWTTKEVKQVDGKDAPMVYEFVNCLMAIDVTAVTPVEDAPGANSTAFDANCKALANALTMHPTMTVRLAYKGLDIAYAKAQVALGVEKNLAYRSGELKSPAFKLPDGSYATSITGLSGELVEAKLVIKEFVPNTPEALNRVKLGPLARQRVR